jgi:outer membrane protein
LGATTAAARPGTLTLGEAYRQALAQSEQVQVALANRDLADVQHTGALTIMGPTAVLRATGTYQSVPPYAGQPPTTFEGGQLDATLTQPLFRRQIFDARRAASLGVSGAEEQLKRARQQLMFDVATAFIGVLRARQQVVIAQGAVKRAETQLQSATTRFKAGAALKTAELLAQIDLNRAQTQVNTAVGSLRAAESILERLTGIAPPDNLVLPTTPTVESDADSIERSRSQRPDVRSLHLLTEQAQATVSTLQGRLFWPTFDVVVNGGYFMFRTQGEIPYFYLFGNLNVPLFQTGDEWVQVKLQKQRVRLAAANEALLRRQVGDDVRQAYARMQTAQKAIEISIEQLRTANQNYQAVNTNYKAGTATVLELVTAQAAVFEAETNKVLSSYEKELATYQLLFAQGKIDL